MTQAATGEPVLLVEDDADLSRLLEFNLRDAGFNPVVVASGQAGLDAAAKARPVVALLDLMLPDLPGTEICRRLRESPELSDVGIIMITARSDEYDRVLGFELGADDYVVKPFSVREVILRVRALARRCGERRDARARAEGGRPLKWRGLEVDTVRHRVFAEGQELQLRPMEFKLLSMLIEHPGEVFTRDRLLEEVWGISADVSTRTVDTHVRRVRQRLGSYGDAIETVHGYGYRLREP
jgi:two-component system phosphate regulon response regulator PhoB